MRYKRRRRRNPEAMIDHETAKHLNASLQHLEKASIALMRVHLPGLGVIALQKVLATIVGKMQRFIESMEGR